MLIDLLRQAAEQTPEQPVVISNDRPVSYADCLQRSEAVARGLYERGIDRFGCAGLAPEDLVVAVAAASASGSEPCLYPRDLDAEGLSRFAHRFSHPLILADAPMELDGAGVVTLDELAASSSPVPPSPPRAPVLILTTGTTGEQKGARHDWSRLVQSVRRPDHRPGTRWLLAFNLNQFAGVQVLLQVLVSGATLVAPPSRLAEHVIETIKRHRVTHLSATPTFWRLLVGRLDETIARELPLEQITLGGEAASEGVIKRLHTLFPEARISHVYAGTEFGSVVSVGDGHSGLPLSVLNRAEDADVRLRIVEGELEIRSRVGMVGYHEGEDDESQWRSTGDLVEVRGDRIHFVGRTTEIINVGGAKVHPLPVEELACSVEGVQLAAVYGQPNPVTGQIVAMDVVAMPGVDRDELRSRLREASRRLPAAGRPRRIRFVEELETRGNKVLRRETAGR